MNRKNMNLQVGDIVYNLHDGKGVVVSTNLGGEFPIAVKFRNNYSCSFTVEGHFYGFEAEGNEEEEECRRLSYTPVSIWGLTTEKPNWKDLIGKLCIFYEEGNNFVNISRLHNYIKETIPVFFTEFQQPYSNCIPYSAENVERVLKKLGKI